MLNRYRVEKWHPFGGGPAGKRPWRILDTKLGKIAPGTGHYRYLRSAYVKAANLNTAKVKP